MVVIGIDPSVTTGYAVSDGKGKVIEAGSVRLWELFVQLELWHKCYGGLIVIEDARKRKWYGHNADQKREGAGWVKTLCGEIEKFLTEKEIPHRMIHPIKHGTKLNAEVVKKLTGYEGRTNEHARDAIMIAWSYK